MGEAPPKFRAQNQGPTQFPMCLWGTKNAVSLQTSHQREGAIQRKQSAQKAMSGVTLRKGHFTVSFVQLIGFNSSPTTTKQKDGGSSHLPTKQWSLNSRDGRLGRFLLLFVLGSNSAPGVLGGGGQISEPRSSDHWPQVSFGPAPRGGSDGASEAFLASLLFSRTQSRTQGWVDVYLFLMLPNKLLLIYVLCFPRFVVCYLFCTVPPKQCLCVLVFPPCLFFLSV